MKKNTLFYLEKAKGSFVSGADIAKSLGVSRMAVSQSVAELKKEGFVIESKPGSGYRLIGSSGKLYPTAVRAHLNRDLCVYCHECIGSTNEQAKRLAAEGAEHGTVVIAQRQTAGRGRYGRSFFSPEGSGIYMSIIIRPDKKRDGVMYTVAAAVALRRVLSEYNSSVSIKWVNDIYSHDRKICGILCEAVSCPESGTLSAVICGIGINITAPDGGFPPDIRQKAGWLCDKEISAAELSAKVADTVLDMLETDSDTIISEYEKHMMLVGRDVYYNSNGKTERATVIGVDSTGGLIVRTEETQTVLRSGEVQLEKF